jgi:hypothetical protein
MQYAARTACLSTRIHIHSPKSVPDYAPCMHACTIPHIHTPAFTYTHIHTNQHSHTYTYTHTIPHISNILPHIPHIHTQTSTHIHKHIQTNQHSHTRTYTYTNTRKQTSTHIHTHNIHTIARYAQLQPQQLCGLPLLLRQHRQLHCCCRSLLPCPLLLVTSLHLWHAMSACVQQGKYCGAPSVNVCMYVRVCVCACACACVCACVYVIANVLYEDQSMD